MPLSPGTPHIYLEKLPRVTMANQPCPHFSHCPHNKWTITNANSVDFHGTVVKVWKSEPSQVHFTCKFGKLVIVASHTLKIKLCLQRIFQEIQRNAQNKCTGGQSEEQTGQQTSSCVSDGTTRTFSGERRVNPQMKKWSPQWCTQSKKLRLSLKKNSRLWTGMNSWPWLYSVVSQGCSLRVKYKILIFVSCIWEMVITCTRWGPTMFSGEGGGGGVIQDTTYLMNHMDKIYWP